MLWNLILLLSLRYTVKICNYGVSSLQSMRRTPGDLVHAEPILAVCNTICYTRIQVHAHREALY